MNVSLHAGIVGAPSARPPEDISLPMKLPPPAHSHHRRADATSDHILPDGGMQPHRSPARNMPSPRGYGGDHLPPDVPPPREDLPWPGRRTIPPPLPCLPPTPCTASTSGRAVPKFSAATSGPPPLIHELVKGVSGGGSIVLGTPLSPEQRRRHFELPPAVGMLYKGGNDPNMLRSGFAGPMPTQPPPPPHDGQFPIIARQSGVPWAPGHMPQSVIRATGDANVATSSRDLLYGDLLTARQMHRSQVAAPSDVSSDRRRMSPRGVGSYAPPSWQHSSRSGRSDPAGPQYLDDVHRADILNTMLPWPVRPPANITRYSVCGEPSRQCYTPPLPIHKAFVGRDPVPGGERSSRHDGADAPTPGRFPDPARGGPKISPYKDGAENVAELRRIDIRRSPTADSREASSASGHQSNNQGTVQASPVTTTSDQLTAANLIDAIIIEQINQDVGPPIAKPHGHSPGRAAAGAGNVSILERLRTDTSTNDQSAAVSSAAPMLRSPTVSEQQSLKPSPGDAGHASRKDLTLGEHIHSIIMHDFKQKDGDATDDSAFDNSATVGKI